MALARKIAVPAYHRRGEGGLTMVTALYRSLLAVLAITTLATAADVPRSRTPEDQDLSDARARIEAKDWPGAVDVLKKAVARDPGNAEYHNLFAYSVRHTANPDMNVVFQHYREALSIAFFRSRYSAHVKKQSLSATCRGRRSTWPRSTSSASSRAPSTAI